MSYKKLWEIGSFKFEPPNERSLQIIYSPQVDERIQNVTVAMSTIAPHSGKTGIHTHPVDEVIYVITGRGECEEDRKTFKIEPGTIIYAPAGVKHDCRNFSDETMQMFCVYVPALPDEVVEKITKNAELRVKKI
ncbi:cupin domain-containing protein [Candidatus Atribacteria bacterium HGW-Atribacteria-1]|nr:MAG: cupin domain-containing protein [Candidatus Atribacteria bacterium HGW-Atribacteria-1]